MGFGDWEGPMQFSENLLQIFSALRFDLQLARRGWSDVVQSED